MEATAAATTGLAKRPVVLFPSPGMGHLVSMIEPGKLLGARGLPVTIVVIEPPYNTGATGPFLAGVSAANPSISFHRLPKVESLPRPVKSKHREAITFEVIRVSIPHLREFMAAASPAPAVLVVDLFCGIALDVAEELRVPAYFFFTSGAQVLAFFLHLPVLHERTAASFQDMWDELVHVPGILPFPATHSILPIMERDDAAYDCFLKLSTDICRSQGVIVNTLRTLEQRVVEAMAAGHSTPPGVPVPPVYCIGPLIKSEEVLDKRGEECLAWLDAQPRASVVLLCFGSTAGRFSVEQVREMAAGLEASGQRFLWVVRAPPSDDPAKKYERPPEPDLDALLPEGFLARTKDRGFVVKSWAPQRQVLAHESVGAFVTHCGWNSVLEAVMAGVPMVAWPLHAEQRLNRVFLEKEMRLGVAVEGYDTSKGVVFTEEIAAKMRWLIDSESQDGRMLRERMLEVMRQAKDALREGGESEATLAGLVDQWKHTCS